MTTAVLIPARYASTRFPGKLMQMIGAKPVIQHVYDNAVATQLFDYVAVVTDHAIIYDALKKVGAEVFMSSVDHENGTSRIAEIATQLPYDIIINIQGDEPFLNEGLLSEMIATFERDVTQQIEIVTPMSVIDDMDQVNSPNVVKVIVNKAMDAMYFSRSPIPFKRDKGVDQPYYRHIGIYGFRKESLLKAVQLSQTPLDACEMIECLRYLEHDLKIKMILTQHKTIAIDVPEDLALAQDYFRMVAAQVDQLIDGTGKIM